MIRTGQVRGAEAQHAGIHAAIEGSRGDAGAFPEGPDIFWDEEPVE